ncbi:MAG: urate hydroxylase PuuD, partial [Deltaproteobacteria bacterium]|nr:urate hydroxylase PuuD [Deltaproteobacteria bacterium]
MSAQEWFNLFVRGAHVLAAILWIGDSFLFMWLDSKLTRPAQPREGDVVGELWMAHSGGFYELVKRRSLSTLPKELFFFKWESYSTWITGMLLLASAYWFGNRSMLVDGAASVSQPVAVGISVGLLALGTAVYHALCHTPLIRSVAAFGAVGLVAVTGLAAALTDVFAPRAVWLQIGAMLGTIMTSNVFFVIVDAQRHMVAATAAGTPVDTAYGTRAKQRSTHNHYLTFPVLLAMLSNHYPGLYASPVAPLVLALVFLVAVGVKYAMSHREQTPGWVAAGTVAALLAVIVATRPTGAAAAVSLADVPTVPFATAEAIVQTRCVSCHADHPTNPGFSAPPQGVALETPDAMRAHAERILQWAVT